MPFFSRSLAAAGFALALIASNHAGAQGAASVPNAMQGFAQNRDLAFSKEGYQQRTVPTVRLDTFLQQRALRPDLVKIDIEGAEYACLLGAVSVVQQFRPKIFLATHGREIHSACTELLTKWRYRLASLDARPPDATDEVVASPAERS